MVDSLLLAHCREILGIDEHTEQVVKRVGLDENLQPSSVEAEGTQCVREGGEDFASDGNLIGRI